MKRETAILTGLAALGGLLLFGGGSEVQADTGDPDLQGWANSLDDPPTGRIEDEPQYSSDQQKMVHSGKALSGLALVQSAAKYADRGLFFKHGGNGPDRLPYACWGRDVGSMTGCMAELCTNDGAMDCSSVPERAARDLGVKIPRTARAQYQACRGSGGRILSAEEAKRTPGALLFFTPSKIKSHITHVEISKGNGQIIASHTGQYDRTPCLLNGKSVPPGNYRRHSTAGVRTVGWGWWLSAKQQSRYGWHVVGGVLPHFNQRNQQ